ARRSGAPTLTGKSPLIHRPPSYDKGHPIRRRNRPMQQTPTPGVLEVITGPMFSGKSEELIRRLKRARIARQRVACYKPDIDLRYHRTAIASHSSQTHDACTVASVERLKAELFPQLQEV